MIYVTGFCPMGCDETLVLVIREVATETRPDADVCLVTETPEFSERVVAIFGHQYDCVGQLEDLGLELSDGVRCFIGFNPGAVQGAGLAVGDLPDLVLDVSRLSQMLHIESPAVRAARMESALAVDHTVEGNVDGCRSDSSAAELGGMLALAGHLSTVAQVREWIEGVQ